MRHSPVWDADGPLGDFRNSSAGPNDNPAATRSTANTLDSAAASADCRESNSLSAASASADPACASIALRDSAVIGSSSFPGLSRNALSHSSGKAKAVRSEMTAASNRSENRRDAKHSCHEALKPASSLRGNQIGQRGEAAGHSDAATDALQSAKSYEFVHRRADARKTGAGHKDAQTDDEQRFTPIQITESAGDRCNGRRPQNVSGGDPRVAIKSANVGHDGVQRRRDDRLAQRAQEHRQGDADHRRTVSWAAL